MSGRWIVLLISSLLFSCGSPEPEEKSDLSWWWNRSETLNFNFASHARNQPGLESLRPYIASGDSHLELGRRDRFQVQTNATIDTELSSSKKQARAQFWADGYVFNQQIGGRGRGSLVDIQAESSLTPIRSQGLVRFLGQEKLKGKLQGKWDQTFTRNLGVESVYYPVPLLGVRVKGNIGGEIGYRSELGINATDALTLSFLPKASLHAGVTGDVEALAFAKAEVLGSVKIIDSSLSSVASISYLPDMSLVLADIGVAGGQINAIDGQIDIGAAVGPSLPSGVDQGLWSWVLGSIGKNFNWEWKHTLWNPDAIFAREIPKYGHSKKHFLSTPKSQEDCLNRAKSYQSYVQNIGRRVDDRVRDLDDEHRRTGKNELLDQMRVEASMKTNYQVLFSEVISYCQSI